MKKLFLLALTVICCLALSLPAMAGVRLGGNITSSFNYMDRDAARATGGNIPPGTLVYDNGFEDLSFDVPFPLNYLYAVYTSKDKTVGGQIRIRFGSAGAGNLNQTSFGNYGGTANANNLDLYFAYIDYHFSEKFRMRFGRQFTILAPMSPSQLSGTAQYGHIVGINFGNVNHTSTRDGMTAEFKLSPMVRLQVGIFDNDTDNREAPLGFGTNPVPAGAVPPTIREENDLPRFDIALPISWNWLKVVPSFSYLTQEYDQVASGSESDIDAWAGALSASATFGPFSIEGEIVFGENLGSGNYVGGSLLNSNLTSYQDPNNNWRIADTDDLAWYIELSWKFGPATLYGMYGQLNSESEGNPMVGLDAAEYDVTRQFYGFACPISIGGGFTIRPELFFYEYDDSALMAGNQNLDMGEEMLIALLFMLHF
jgi:hypothetical protein